jgi:hypothetical protein
MRRQRMPSATAMVHFIAALAIARRSPDAFAASYPRDPVAAVAGAVRLFAFFA